MKELHRLMQYMDLYVYNKELDEIVVVMEQPKTQAAYETLVEAMAACHVHDNEVGTGYYLCASLRGQKALWRIQLDIAIDCVKNMPEDVKQEFLQNFYVGDYHFGYAMYIRNHYISPSKNVKIFDADMFSEEIIRVVHSILCEEYDYSNRQLYIYFKSYIPMRKEYISLRTKYHKTDADLFTVYDCMVAKGRVRGKDARKWLQEDLLMRHPEDKELVPHEDERCRRRASIANWLS